MANPTYSEIQYDMGIARNVEDGSTAIKSFIAKAQNVITGVTGTTTGNQQDLAIRAVADMFTANAQLGGLGPASSERVPIEIMRERFRVDANDALRVIGKTIDGIKIQFTQVNP